MRNLFISDLHLDESRPHLTRAFLSFLLEEVRADDILFILGDLFEVWLGDDHETEFNRNIIEAIKGVPAQVCLMHGNRDFLLGEKFCHATGADLLNDPTIIDCFGTKVLIMHGDTLCTDDTDYINARRLLRNPAFQHDFLSKPITERAVFARSVREQSRNHTNEASETIMDVNPDEVVRVMAEHAISTLVHGHTHRPYIHELHDHRLRIVLGDWNEFGWVLEYSESGYNLRRFRIDP